AGRDGRRHSAGRCPRRADRTRTVSAIVTGGASGIGAAAAVRLRRAGHDVITWDLRGGDIDCDISDPGAVAAALEQTLAEVGVPDRLVACAAVGASGMLIAQDPADW